MSAKPTSAHPVELHYFRDTTGGEPITGYLVTVPDSALVALNKGHAFRGLTIAFNGTGRPSARLKALSDALREAEETANPSGGMMADAGPRRRFVRWVVGVAYKSTRWMRKAKK